MLKYTEILSPSTYRNLQAIENYFIPKVLSST